MDRETTGKTISETDDIFYKEAQDKLKMLLGTTVRIKQRGSKKRLEIDFASQDELNYVIKLLERLSKQLKELGELFQVQFLFLLKLKNLQY